ncbi:wins1 2 protein [Anaeramoeba ignava]|uniref:Wins1 2 protein n=1 Tax=Anaeramoeba ignava TaxID=1746090 RepID=A0A9Q0L534_ANAIG|nr:wins1 2 protein [Anaeramoeba ignava]
MKTNYLELNQQNLEEMIKYLWFPNKIISFFASTIIIKLLSKVTNEDKKIIIEKIVSKITNLEIKEDKESAGNPLKHSLRIMKYALEDNFYEQNLFLLIFNWFFSQNFHPSILFPIFSFFETLIDQAYISKENKNFLLGSFSSRFIELLPLNYEPSCQKLLQLLYSISKLKILDHQQIQKLSNKIIENSSILFGNEELKQFSISLFFRLSKLTLENINKENINEKNYQHFFKMIEINQYLQQFLNNPKLIIDLVFSNDELLIQILDDFLFIYLKLKQNQDEKISNFRLNFSPIKMFEIFAQEISFDHTILLDWILSAEMSELVLVYLLHFLKFYSNYLKLKNLNENKKRKIDEDLSVEKEGIQKIFMKLYLSISSSYQKNLFPFNPTQLLKRISEII